MDKIIREKYQSNTTSKTIEWYIGRDRKMKNNFRNCLMFMENKLFSTNYTLYYNYKIIIYSHTSSWSATCVDTQNSDMCLFNNKQWHISSFVTSSIY